MKKRILSMLLTVAMIFSMLPTMTLPAMAADDTHTSHPVCGASCNDHNLDGEPEGHTNITWTELTAELLEENSYILTTGNYYLADDITIAADAGATTTWTSYGYDDVIAHYGIKLDGEVSLCLNGHTLYYSNGSVIGLDNSDVLNLCDCSSEESGKISGGTGTPTNAIQGADTLWGGGIQGLNDSILNMYGGMITENNCDYSAAIDFSGNAVNLYGGKITQNTGTGYIVGFNGEVMSMYGGEIVGNNGSGDGIELFMSVLNMYGGKIHGQPRGVDLSTSAKMNMYGGEVSGTSKSSIFLSLENTLYINGGKIGTDSSVTSIDVNYHEQDQDRSKITLGGSPTILGKIELGGNVPTFEIENGFAVSSPISIYPESTTTGVIAKPASGSSITEEQAAMFVDARDYFKVVLNDDGNIALSNYDIVVPESIPGIDSIEVVESARHGERVNVTITPAAGCTVKDVKVTYIDANGDEEPVTTYSNGTWFYMPAADVKIVAEAEYEVTTGIVEMEGLSDAYTSDAFNVYLYDEFGELAGTQQLDSSNGWKATFNVPLTYTGEDDEEYDVTIGWYTIKIDKLDGYTATLSPYLSGDEVAAMGVNFAIFPSKVDNIDLTVSDTEHIYDTTEKGINFEVTSPEGLTKDNFTVTYYEINENTGELNVLDPMYGQAPKAVGKYLYVIEYTDEEDESGEGSVPKYVFANPYVDTEYISDLYYPVEGEAMPLPDGETVTYDNAGIMTIEAPGRDIGTMSWKESFIEVFYSDDISNELTSELVDGAQISYTSSNADVATIDENGSITKGDATGTTTITATAQCEGYASKTATFVLKINPDQYVITLKDKEVTYGEEITGNAVAKVEVNGFDKTNDYTGLGGIGTAITVDYSGYVPGSSVGNYKITGAMRDTAPGDTNVYTFIPATLTVMPKELTDTDFVVTADDKIYDKTDNAKVSATVSSLVNNDDQVTVLVSGTFADADAGDNKVVSYTITGLAGADAGNYKISNDIRGTTSATITKALATVLVGSSSHVYDGTKKDLTVYVYADGQFIFDFAKSYTYGNGLTTGAPDAVGTYTLVLNLTGNAANNYVLGNYEATLTIMEANGDFMVIKPEAPIYYGDTDKKIEVKGDEGYSVTYEVTQGNTIASISDDGTLNFSGIGEVTVKVTGTKTNYQTETDSVTFTVLPRPVSASVTVSDREYDGTTDMKDEVGAITLTDYAGNEVTKVKATAKTATISNPNVGEHTATVELELSGDDAGFYALTQTNAYDTVNISKKQVTISITAQDKVYDETTAATVTVSLEGVIDAETDSVFVSGSAVFESADAANDKKVTYTAQGLLGDKSGNYELVNSTATAKANITKRPVNFSFGALTFPYDGSAKSVVISAATDDGKVFSDYTVVYGGNLTNGEAIYAGEYPITITINDTNYKLADDYAAKTMTITMIDQHDLMITNVPSENPQYDTTFPLGTFGGDGTGKVVWSSDDATVATVDENGVVTVTGVGAVTITATKQSDGGYNAISATATIITAARNVSFQISDLEHIFNGTAKSVTVTPSVTGATYEITYSGDKATNGQAVNAGTYTVTVTANGSYTGSTTATMVISKADINVSGFAVEDTTYGTAAKVTIPEHPAGVTSKLTFIVNGEDSADQPKNASEAEYTAKLVLSGDNYNTKTLEDTFMIGKATLTVTANNASRAYGQNNPDFTLSYTGFRYEDNESVINVKPTAATTATPVSAVGAYDITVSGGSDDNYIFEYVSGTLTVTKTNDEGEIFIPGVDEPLKDPDDDGLYEDEEGNKHIPGEAPDDPPKKVTDEDGDDTYEDEEGNKYIGDQDGDGEAESEVKDENGNGTGIFEGSKNDDNDDDGDDEYYVDIDGPGGFRPATKNEDGVYETNDGEDDKYIPDQDGDGDPEKVVDNGNGTYTEDEDGDDEADEGGNTYIPDQNGDGDPESEIKDEDGNGTGIFEDEDENKYIPDQDDDSKPEKVTDEDGDGIYEDEDRNKYIPDQDGDGEVEKVTDNDNDGIYEDEDGNKYIPDQDGDGKVEPDTNGDGIFEGSDNDDNGDEEDNFYVPDGDDDGTDPDKVTDKDGDGIYEDEDGNKYIPDQNGDGKPEKVTDEDGDGIYEDEDGNEYIPDQDGNSKPEKVTDEDGDGIYEDEDGNKYLPDQDGDGKVEPDTNGDGVFEGSDKDKGETYIPVDTDGDGENDDIAKDDDGDGLYEDEDGNKYIPKDEDDDDAIDGGTKVEDEDGDGIFEDEDGNEYKPDDSGNYNPYVATPVIDPNGGTFTGSQSVTITTTTDGATIYYTTDGSAPSAANGTAYTGAITISDSTTIKAIAVKGEVVSGVAETTFTKRTYYPPIIVPTYYDIIVNPSANGDVDASRKSATSGTTITLTVDPDNGYKLNTLTVTDTYGNAVIVTAKANGTYTFRMPSRDVYVTATFTKEADTPVIPPVHICPSKEFSDVDTNQWYHEAIDFVLANGYMNGMGNGQFQPGTALNRAMIVQVLYNMENRPDYNKVSSFEDVKSGDWYYDAINWAAENKIVNGYSDTAFGPNDPITREQMAAILYRYADYKDIDVTARGSLSIFTDGNKTSSWALDEVRWAVKVGLISGKGNGVLDPTGTANRAEVAQILMNYCKKVLGE